MALATDNTVRRHPGRGTRRYDLHGAIMANGNRFYARRQSCTARQLTKKDLDAAAIAARDSKQPNPLEHAAVGDYVVTQPGHGEHLWRREAFEEQFEPADGDEGGAISIRDDDGSGDDEQGSGDRIAELEAELAQLKSAQS